MAMENPIKWNKDMNYGAGSQEEAAEKIIAEKRESARKDLLGGKRFEGDVRDQIKMGLVEKSTPAQLEADRQRVGMIMKDLWIGGKISLYEQSFNTPSKMEEVLPEVENIISAIENSDDINIVVAEKNVSDTIKKLTKIRDHIKLSLLRG